MITEFIKLRLLETTRSAVWNKNLAINILFGFMMLYLAASFVMTGFFLDRMLERAFPDNDPVSILNGALLYYFGLELLIRFFMQQTPAMTITPFMHLPLKRSFLMHFLLVRSSINPLNYISFLIFLPFAVRAVSMYYSGIAALGWLLTLFLMIILIIYLNVYIKRQMTIKPIVSLGGGLAFVALIALDYFGVFSLSTFSTTIFNATLNQPVWILALVVLANSVYLLNYRLLKACFYPEAIDRKGVKKQVATQSLSFMSRFGQIGELIGLELKLILRHKRTKSVIYVTPIFLLYGFLYNTPGYSDSAIWLIFVGIIVTGMTMLSYGNFIIAWDSTFFDGILTRKGSVVDYFRAKYYLLAFFCIVNYILTTPYAFLNVKYLWVQTACFLFNIGVSALIMIWFANYNRKRIELAQGSAFSWQGTGASHFLTLLPAMLLPSIIVAICKWLGSENLGLVILGTLGLAGLFGSKWIIQSFCRGFAKSKYAMAEGFRNT